MIHTKQLLKMGRKSLWTRSKGVKGSNRCGKAVARKGHFVLYTIDGQRFEVPLSNLHSTIFKELFKMSEDLFGLPGNGPITLPCDSDFMEYVLSLVQRRVPQNVEKAMVISVTTSGSSVSSFFPHGDCNQQRVFHGS